MDGVNSAFSNSSALVVEVVVVEDAGVFMFVPKVRGGTDDTTDALGGWGASGLGAVLYDGVWGVVVVVGVVVDGFGIIGVRVLI